MKKFFFLLIFLLPIVVIGDILIQDTKEVSDMLIGNYQEETFLATGKYEQIKLAEQELTVRDDVYVDIHQAPTKFVPANNGWSFTIRYVGPIPDMTASTTEN